MWLKSFFCALSGFFAQNHSITSCFTACKFTFNHSSTKANLPFHHSNFHIIILQHFEHLGNLKYTDFFLCILGTNSQTRNNAGQTIDRKVFENDLKNFNRAKRALKKSIKKCNRSIYDI